jgi:chemotaxis protein MotB
LLIDRTPEGLRIQVIDQEGKPMFALGSSRPLDRTKQLLFQISQVIKKLPNRISVTGHTDAVPYRGGANGYSNWELSSDRALSARRSLIESGLGSDRLAMVVGRAAEDPLVTEDPNSARNRRIAIVVLRQAQADTPASPGPAPATQFRRDWSGPRVR